ncbi:hypothetical protein CASFOL_025469 [Castilleja foliolosa]|uniref:Uncharacterized protein n=1 Tax=Castilleja foliolosa TaxID=1961234 RepID=A0ABD3CUZ3_9LAMI
MLIRAFLRKPATTRQCTVAALSQFNFMFRSQRGMHSRNKKAMELIAKGFSALQEVDRVIDYCELYDKRLIPYLKTAKEQFELALEADNSNTHARYWLAKLHLKYHHFPGANKAVGAALLVEAAEMGDPEAQYELGCRLRAENPYVQSDQQAFYYLEKAVDQFASWRSLPLRSCVFDWGLCEPRCFFCHMVLPQSTSEKGHAGVELPESLTRFVKNRKSRKSVASPECNPVEMARERFEVAANAGCDIGLKWLEKLQDQDEKNHVELLT